MKKEQKLIKYTLQCAKVVQNLKEINFLSVNSGLWC